MESLSHLPGGITPGTAIGHCQGQRNAVGREEEIIVASSDDLVQIYGEGAVASGQFLQFGLTGMGGKIPLFG
jgi:hypothetical protein